MQRVSACAAGHVRKRLPWASHVFLAPRCNRPPFSTTTRSNAWRNCSSSARCRSRGLQPGSARRLSVGAGGLARSRATGDPHHHRIEALTPREPIRRVDTPDRSTPCPCGCGRKYKKCCGA
ncbi:MAG: SEC-C domain-containing protein [Gammaproteobacteria bacterium]|nr:SEC-C domain-containing protein [Gammaproteobacteria bacterium]